MFRTSVTILSKSPTHSGLFFLAKVMAVRAAQSAEFEASAEGRHIRATMEADKDARGGSLLERHLASKSRKKADLQVLLVTTVIYTPIYNANPSISPLATRYSPLITHSSSLSVLQARGERQRFDRERDVVHASHGGDGNAAKLLMQQAHELQGKFTSTIQKHF